MQPQLPQPARPPRIGTPQGRDRAHLDTLPRCPTNARARRSSLNFVGATLSDDPAFKRTNPPTPRGQARSRTKTLPWPRMADDGETPLGVDLRLRFREVVKLIAAGGFRVRGIDREDLVAEICLVIARRNNMPSAFDPRKGSFGHYVHIIAKHACANLSQGAACGREVLTDTGHLDAEGPEDPLIAQFERLNAEERQRIAGERALAQFDRLSAEERKRIAWARTLRTMAVSVDGGRTYSASAAGVTLHLGSDPWLDLDELSFTTTTKPPPPTGNRRARRATRAARC